MEKKIKEERNKEGEQMGEDTKKVIKKAEIRTELEEKGVKELRKLAKEYKIKNYGNIKKDQLLKELEEAILQKEMARENESEKEAEKPLEMGAYEDFKKDLAEDEDFGEDMEGEEEEVKIVEKQPEGEEGFINTRVLAEMIGTTPRKLRAYLRNKSGGYDDKKYTRYRWKLGEEVERIMKGFLEGTKDKG